MVNIHVSEVVRKSSKILSGAVLMTAGFGIFIPNTLAGTLPSSEPPVVNGWVQVSTPDQLEYIDQNQSSDITTGSTTTYLGANIELMNNIDLTGYSGWVPFGGNSEPAFGGTFNGQGYEITGLNIDDSSDANVGIFGETTGTVENVGVSVTLQGSSGANAALVGTQASGLISYAYSHGTVVAQSGSKGYYSGGGNGGTAGGLVGIQLSGGLIQDSYSGANVSSGSGGDGSASDGGSPGGSGGDAGGLVGQAAGNIKNAYAIGDVTSGNGGSGIGTSGVGLDYGGNGGFAGGLVGDDTGVIVDAYAVGSVTAGNGGNGDGGGGADNYGGTGGYAGALVGSDSGQVTNAYAVGAAVAGSGGVGAGGGYNDGNGSIGVSGGLIGIISGTTSGSCYFNSSANSGGIGSGTTPSDVTGEPVSEFQAPNNPEGTSWDFTNTWAINASVNNGYPFFLPQVLTTSPLPPADVGQPCSYTLTGFDGASRGLTWSSTALPNGLNLSSTGAITGTPLEGYSGDVTVSATDSAGNTASANLQLDVVPEAPDITTQSIGSGTSLGTTEVTATPNSNSDTFAYVLGSTPATTPYVGDPLPNGAATYMSGSDIPNVSAGQYLNMYEVNGSNQIQAWHEYQLTTGDINSAGPTGLTHSSVTQTGWVESWSPVSGASSYNVYLGGQKVGSTTQSVYSYTFTGEKPGTTYSVQVSSVNNSGQESALPAPDSVTTAVYGGGGPIPPYINTVSFMEDAKVGTQYSAQLVTTGGTQPFQWSITNGALPQGLTLNNQGAISGTPTGLGGQYTFTVKVTDANNLTATRPLTLTVDGPTSYPSITTTSLPSDTVGQSYEQTLGATGGTSPYTWSVTKGTLPSGLSLNAQTGEITGSALTSEISNVTIQAIDANGMTVTQTLSIDVLQKNQREIVWNGQIQNWPAVVGNDGGTQTTYMPIWYVMQLLKSMGIQSTWNGQEWSMTASATANLSNIQAGTGSTSIYLNGTLVQNVNTEAQVDPSTNKPTTYMPIWYVQQILNRVGLQSTWNGTTWVVTQQNS